MDPKALTLDLSDLDAIVNAKTRLVAVGYASNAVGTINDVARISRRCREVGALLSVDAVHIAPHKAIDMDAIGADMPVLFRLQVFRGTYRHRSNPKERV